MIMTTTEKLHSNRTLVRTLMFLTSALVCLVIFLVLSVKAAADNTYAHFIVFDANGGVFNDNENPNEPNTIKMDYTERESVIVSTGNVNSNGVATGPRPNISGHTYYPSSEGISASLIRLQLKYGVQSGDNLYVRNGTGTLAYDINNQTVSKSNTLSNPSYTNSSQESHEYIGMTQFMIDYYQSSSYNQSYGYGFYAIITPTDCTQTGEYKVPTKEGSYFLGWSSVENPNTPERRSGYTNNDLIRISKDVNNQTLYAVWYTPEDPVSWKADIIFDANGGYFDDETKTQNTVEMRYQEREKIIEKTDNVSYDGVATGPRPNINGHTYYPSSEGISASLIKLQLKYGIRSGDNLYVRNGTGTLAYDINNQTVSKSNTLSNPSYTNSSQESHEYIGMTQFMIDYYQSSSYNQSYGYGFYAIITPTDCTQTGEYDTPTGEGDYILLGWSTDQYATTAQYGVNLTDKDLIKLTKDRTENLTLYAVWHIPTFYLNFNANASDATGSMENVRGIIGRELTLSECEFSRPYNNNPLTPMVFNGWSLNANGSGKRYADQETIAADDPNFTEEKTYTLYAQWKNPDYYIVKFNGNGGSGSMSNQFATLTADYPVPNAKFFNFKHYFTGWRADDPETGTFYAKGSSIPANTYNTPTQVVTLYAQWEEGEAPPETTNVEIPFELKAGQQATIADLPAGTGYQVWEETPAGWVLQYELDQTGKIVSNSDVTSYYKNRYDPQSTSVSITATKTLDGRVPGQTFSFTLTQDSGPGYDSFAPITVDCTDAGAISFGTMQYNETGNGDGIYVYKITETPGGDSSINYDSHTEEVTVTVATVNGVMTAAVTYDQDGAVFQNVHKPGSLQIKKIVEDGKGNGNPDLEFDFTLSLKDATGTILPDTETFAYEKYNADATSTGETGSIANGGTFKLKAGQYLLISGFDYGTKYSVEEVNFPGGWSIAGAENSTGSIPAAGTAEAVFTNEYIPGSSGGGPGGTQVTLMAHKMLEGDTLQSGQFSFLLEKWNGTAWDTVEQVQNGEIDTAGEILNTAGETIQNPWNGTGPVRFSELSFAGAGEAFYRLTESAASPADERINYATDTYYAKVTVTDDGEGNLNTTVAWYSGWNTAANEPENQIRTAEPLFVNSIKTWPLTISKVLRNAPTGSENTEFSFTLTLKKADGSALILPEPLPTGLTVADSTSGRYLFTLQGGRSLTVPNLPYGSTYTVTETPTDGFALSGKKGDTGAIGTVLAGETEAPDVYTAEFTNTGYTAASTEVPIVKYYHGGSITESGENAFFIHVDQFADENRMVKTGEFDYAVPAAAANAAGDATSRFALPLSYDYNVLAGASEKTIYYRFTEVQGGSSNILYSGASYTGKTVITNEGGGVITAAFILDGGYREAAFNNVRLLELHIDKTVGGNLGDTSKPFDFTVQLSNLPDSSEYADITWTGIVQADTETMGTGFENSWSFTLKHGEDTQVVKIPFGTSYRVTEDPEDYSPSLKVEAQYADGTTKEIDSRTGDRATSRSAVLNEIQYLHYTNTKKQTVDTGVKLALGGCALAAVGLAGYAGMTAKRKKRETEEAADTPSRSGSHLPK